jgi:hypothetical protein
MEIQPPQQPDLLGLVVLMILALLSWVGVYLVLYHFAFK